MDLQRIASYTKDLLDKHGVYLNVDPDVLASVSRSDPSEVKKISQKETFEAPGGLDFKIPRQATSVPFITGINGNNLSLMTYQPGFKQYRPESWAFGPSTHGAMTPTRLHDFRSEVNRINRSRFPNGLNIDSMNLINIRNEPFDREGLQRVLQHGAIVPLSSNRGAFIPNFGISSNFFSYEYEGRFKTDLDLGYGPSEQGKFDSLVTNPIEKNFGVNVKNLLPYDFGSQNSYKAYNDGSISEKPGRKSQEVVVGSAPMSNLLMASDMMFGAWQKEGMLHPDDIPMDRSAGMHISTTLPNLAGSGAYEVQKGMSNYLNNVGLVFDMLGRHADRWKSTAHLGVAENYSSNRNNYRIDTGTRRLEFRHPGPIPSTAYIASQLSIVGKLSNDLIGFGKEGLVELGQRSHSEAYGNLKLSSRRGSAYQKSPFFPLHEQMAGGSHPAAAEMQDWFNSFTDQVGITDPAQKKFLLMMNKSCIKTQSSYF